MQRDPGPEAHRGWPPPALAVGLAYRHTERHTQVREEKDGGAFTLAIPFAPLHPLSVRVRGNAHVRVKTPTGQIIQAWRSFPAEACAIFDVRPETGRYEILKGV